jgi:hypothetical protein
MIASNLMFTTVRASVLRVQSLGPGNCELAAATRANCQRAHLQSEFQVLAHVLAHVHVHCHHEMHMAAPAIKEKPAAKEERHQVDFLREPQEQEKSQGRWASWRRRCRQHCLPNKTRLDSHIPSKHGMMSMMWNDIMMRAREPAAWARLMHNNRTSHS